MKLKTAKCYKSQSTKKTNELFGQHNSKSREWLCESKIEKPSFLAPHRETLDLEGLLVLQEELLTAPNDTNEQAAPPKWVSGRQEGTEVLVSLAH